MTTENAFVTNVTAYETYPDTAELCFRGVVVVYPEPGRRVQKAAYKARKRAQS